MFEFVSRLYRVLLCRLTPNQQCQKEEHPAVRTRCTIFLDPLSSMPPLAVVSSAAYKCLCNGATS